jgi:hypothetical protein
MSFVLRCQPVKNFAMIRSRHPVFEKFFFLNPMPDACIRKILVSGPNA